MLDFTIKELSEKLNNKEISSVELTKSYIENIKKNDDKIGAYISYDFDSAIAKAELIDIKINKGEKLSDLAGIPVGIKDNICTKNVATTCASKMLSDFIPPYDATVMQRLNSADTIMLGKLNMDEFAMGSTTENSSVKTTKNPRNLDYVPGGSSGGSAACVAGNLAPFALGSDTGGSVRQPASFCGVVGVKPTYGSVSRSGLIAFASSLDQIGVMTKDVTDSAMVLNEICAYDKMDSTSVKRDYSDFSRGINDGVRGMKIAVCKEYFGDGLSKEVHEAMLETIKVYESLGATVTYVSLTSLKLALPAYYVISSAEASSNLARFDGVRYGYRAKEFTDVLSLYKNSRSEAFGDEVKRRIMLGTFALSSGYYDAYYKKALEVRTLISNEFTEIFKEFDCILSPVAPTPAYKIGEKKETPLEMYMGDIYTVPVNIAGLPSVAIPAYTSKDGLPIGFQLIGKAFSENTLFRVGKAFETAMKG